MGGAFNHPKRLTLTDVKVIANHLGDEAFACSATNVALVAVVEKTIAS